MFGCVEKDGSINNFCGGYVEIQYGCHPESKLVNINRLERLYLQYCGRGK